MRKMTIALILSALCLGTFVQCSKSKPAEGAAKGVDMTPAMGAVPMGDGMGEDMRVSPNMAAAPALTSGPTGIKECDDLLNMLSNCHKKHPSLKIAYNAVKKDAPGWKAKAQKRDPKQIGELAKACTRTAKEVSEGFKCD